MARIALAFFAGACKPKEWEQSVHILRTLMPAADIEPDAQSFEHVAAACGGGPRIWAASIRSVSDLSLDAIDLAPPRTPILQLTLPA